DAIGLGLYTITGVQIGIQYELAAIHCVVLRTSTGEIGGIMRDILVNEAPEIIKKEVYTTLSILWTILCLVLYRFEVMNPVLQFIPVLFIIGLRLLVIHYNISLPSLYADERKKKQTGQ